jgi:hypothetical protein
MGKSSINGPFSMAMLNNQRVDPKSWRFWISFQPPTKKISTRPGKHTKSDIENGPVEIVDFPSYKMVIFHSYVNVYHRVIFRVNVGKYYKYSIHGAFWKYTMGNAMIHK